MKMQSIKRVPRNGSCSFVVLGALTYYYPSKIAHSILTIVCKSSTPKGFDNGKEAVCGIPVVVQAVKDKAWRIMMLETGRQGWGGGKALERKRLRVANEKPFFFFTSMVFSYPVLQQYSYGSSFGRHALGFPMSSACLTSLPLFLLHFFHYLSCACVSLPGDSTRLISASADASARMWDVQTGRELVVYNHMGPVRSCAFAEGAQRFATVSDPFTDSPGLISVFETPDNVPTDHRKCSQHILPLISLPE